MVKTRQKKSPRNRNSKVWKKNRGMNKIGWKWNQDRYETSSIHSKQYYDKIGKQYLWSCETESKAITTKK